MAEYDPFVAYSGSYDIAEGRITFQPRVSLNPSFMGGGARTDEFEVDGDTLWLIMRPRSGSSGTVQEVRTKLVRLEGGVADSGPTFRANE